MKLIQRQRFTSQCRLQQPSAKHRCTYTHAYYIHTHIWKHLSNSLLSCKRKWWKLTKKLSFELNKCKFNWSWNGDKICNKLKKKLEIMQRLIANHILIRKQNKTCLHMPKKCNSQIKTKYMHTHTYIQFNRLNSHILKFRYDLVTIYFTYWYWI